MHLFLQIFYKKEDLILKRLINDKKKKLNLVFSFLKNKNEIFKFANVEIDKNDLKNIYNAVNEEFAFNEPEALAELKNEMPIENQDLSSKDLNFCIRTPLHIYKSYQFSRYAVLFESIGK